MRGIRRILVPVVVLVATAGLVATASATHLTSITVNESNVTVAPGHTASYTGIVNNTSDSPECLYGWTMSLTGAPTGSTVTFTPASEPFGTAQGDHGYTLDIQVPAGTVGGVYPLTITATWDGGSSTCSLNPPSRAVNTNLTVKVGACPQGGGWSLQPAGSGNPYDKNADGWICSKQIPGNGIGNTGNGQNNKDNNG
jgi:hypothetical protein